MATLNVEDWALRELTLDTADMVVPDFLIANAADIYGRGIDLQITQDGEPAEMDDMMTVYLVWRHRNGNQDLTEFEAVSAESGHYRVYYPPAMMYGGEVVARISIYVGTEKLTGSRNFRIIVEPNPINEDEALSDESLNAFKEAVEALSALEKTVSKNEEERQANEETRKANEDARIAAENERASAEEERQANEETRKENETERQANEETRQENESTRETNEGERVTEWEKLKDEIQAATDAANNVAGLDLPLSIENGGTGNTEGLAASATKLATARTIRTNLASTSSASFDGTANITPGVTGTLPISSGGTGLTSAPSLLTNLASTTAASPFQASPRPGVTGILPVANGGTGASSLEAIQGLPQAYFGKYERSTTTTDNVSLSAGALTVVNWDSGMAGTDGACYISDSDYFTIQSDGAAVCKKAGMVLIVASSYMTGSTDAQFGTYIYSTAAPSSSNAQQLAGCYASTRGDGVQCVALAAVNANTPIYHVVRSSVAATLLKGNPATWMYIVYLWCS